MTKKNKKKFIILFSIIFSVLSLSVFYIFQMVKISETAYINGKNTTNLEKLREEVSDLKLSISKQKNLKNAEEKIIEKGFQKVSSNTISYIVIPEISLANK